MPDKCFVFGCNNRTNKEKGISLHQIPFDGSDNTKKRKITKKWVEFVKACTLGAHVILGGVFEHFRDEDYAVMFSGLSNVKFQRRLRKDDIKFFELNKRSFNKILNPENTEPIKKITGAMRAKAWNDVISSILPFARSCFKRRSL